MCRPSRHNSIWHVNSSSGVATSVSELLPCYFTYFTFSRRPYTSHRGLEAYNVAYNAKQILAFRRNSCRDGFRICLLKFHGPRRVGNLKNSLKWGKREQCFKK